MYRTLTSAALLAALAALACPWAASAHTATLTLDCAAGHAATQGFHAPPGSPLNWTRTVDGQPSGAGQVALAAHIDVTWTPPLSGTHTVSWRLTWNTGGESGSATSPTVTLTCAPAPPPPAPAGPPAAPQFVAPPPPPAEGSVLDIATSPAAVAPAASPAAPATAVLPAVGSGVKGRVTARKPDRTPLTCRQRVARGLTRPGRCNTVLAKRSRAVLRPSARNVAVTG